MTAGASAGNGRSIDRPRRIDEDRPGRDRAGRFVERLPPSSPVWRAALTGAALCLFLPGAEAASPRPGFLRSCVISPPDQAPLFPAAAPAKADGKKTAKAADDESDDDADSDDDDDDDDSDGTAGVVAPGLGHCIAVTGTLTAGIQRDAYKVGALVAATGLAPRDVTSFPLTASFRIESAQTLANGLYLASAFEFSIDGTSATQDATLSEASVTLGAWQFGLASSRFDFWTGDDFVFLGRIPSRTVSIVGYERALTETTKLSLSLEGPGDSQQSLPGSAGRNFPDGVARLFYESGELTIQGAVAVREVPVLGGPSRFGRAGLIGATWTRTVFGRPMTLSGQVAGAIDAAVYIGSKLDRRTAVPLLTGDESTRGWSGVVSLGREWTKTWSTNAYLSRYALSLPQIAGASGSIRIDRLAANVVWKPVEGFKAGLETSIAWQRVDLAGRRVAIQLAGRQQSLQLFLERDF